MNKKNLVPLLYYIPMALGQKNERFITMKIEKNMYSYIISKSFLSKFCESFKFIFGICCDVCLIKICIILMYQMPRLMYLTDWSKATVRGWYQEGAGSTGGQSTACNPAV